MRPALTIAWRDFRSAFNAPGTYYLFACFLGIVGLLFVQRLLQFSDLSDLARSRAADNPAVLEGISLDTFVVTWTVMWLLWLLMVVVPLLTMRTFAEETRGGTLELLLTAPVSPTGLVIGKFLGAWGLVLTPVLLTTWFPVVLRIVADPDAGPLLAAYVGIVLGSAVFTAVGVLCSALTDSPPLAAFLAFAALLGSALAGFVTESFPGPVGVLLRQVAILSHLDGARRGVLDTGDAAWLVIATFAVLFVTQRVIESRRWR